MSDDAGALARASRIGHDVARVGFDWPSVSGPLQSLREEVDELAADVAAGDTAAAARELGDVLFAAVNVARHLGVDPGEVLDGTSERFMRRFRWVEARLAERGLRPNDTDLETLDALWNEAKRALAHAPA